MTDLVRALAEEAHVEGLRAWSFCSGAWGGSLGPALVALMPFAVHAEDALPESMAGRGGYTYPAFIAPFARANHYRALARSLGRIASAAARRAGLSKDSFRVSVNSNSGIDERALAIRAGLGSIGRNGLLASPRFGSLCIIGALILPPDQHVPYDRSFSDSHNVPPQEPGSSCGSCRTCVEACPTGALGRKRGFVRERCLQHYAGLPGPLPKDIEASWGPRLYGCRTCQAVCPLNQYPSEGSPGLPGQIGSAIEAGSIVGASDEEVRARFKGTSLGMSFVSPAALRRNAALSIRYWERRA